MGRRGWQAIEVPQEWFNVIRGPRPPSVRWPQAQSSRQSAKVVRDAPTATPVKVSVGRPRSQQSSGGVSVRKSGPAPTPEEIMERARRRAMQLESAMQLLDAEDPALVPLQENLKKAKAQASAPPLADRVSASEMYVARKKKRLEEAEQEILEAIKSRDILKAEVVAGEERLAGLKAELTRAASAPPQVRGAARCSIVEQFFEKTGYIAPNQWGSHTDGPHPSHAVFGASRIESVVARSTILPPGNPRIGWPARSGVGAHINVIHGAVRMMEMNGGMVP